MKAASATTHPSKRLFTAIEAKDFGELVAALEQGADANEFLDGVDMNPLSKVLSNVWGADKPKFIKKLMEHGALPGLSNDNGSTAFMRACMRGDVASASAMMECAQLDLLHRDDHGWICSMSAVCDMSPEFLQKLQDRFESQHWKQNPGLPRNHLWTSPSNDGSTAMMVAMDKPESLKWLLNHPDLNMANHLEARCNEGRTVLWLAAEKHHFLSVQLLLGAGARTKTHNLNGKQLMDHLAGEAKKASRHQPGAQADRMELTMQIMRAAHASQEASLAIDELMSRKIRKSKVGQAWLFIERGADVSARNGEGHTPLHMASIEGESAVREAFIAFGADINAKTNDGSTPLHLAAKNGNHAICLDLIRLGADIGAKDNKNKTTLDLAANAVFPLRNERAWLALVAHGAEISARGKGLSTPFAPITAHQAAAKGGFTHRLLHLMENEPSGSPEDQPSALVDLARSNSQDDTAAALQALMARMEIDKMMNGQKSIKAGPSP
jgi:ankyrin repeat protein